MLAYLNTSVPTAYHADYRCPSPRLILLALLSLARFACFLSTTVHPQRPRHARRWRSHVCQALESEKSSSAPANTTRPCGPGQDLQLIEVNGSKRRRVSVETLQYEDVSDSHDSNHNGPGILDRGLLEAVQDFLLPKGFPQAVTEDYLEYQVRCLPAHITGWMSRSLATSSLLQALNLGSTASTTVAASAAIKWITKDGIGAFGRFLVGGRLSGVFDEDPRRWRMIAVGFATVGLAFEIATTAFPSNFIILAGAGNFTKALGKGLSQPSFRIIQTHFAKANNVGDISAKEEVWEVSAQLLGLGGSVLLLKAIESSGAPTSVLWVWALIQVVHVSLRYYALRALGFRELNQKRASILVQAHHRGESLPDVRQANNLEPMLASSSGVGPPIQFGTNIATAFHGSVPLNLQQFKALYKEQRYWLVWHGRQGYALLGEDFQPIDILQILLQGCHLEAKGIVDAEAQDYQSSLSKAEAALPELLSSMQVSGWDPQYHVYRLGDVRLALA